MFFVYFFVFLVNKSLIYALLFCLFYKRLSFFSLLISSPILLFSFHFSLISWPTCRRLPPDNSRGFSSGPAERWGRGWGRCLRVFLPPHLRARLYHLANDRRAPNLFLRGGNCHHGDKDYQNHPAPGWNTNRRVFNDHSNNKNNNSSSPGVKVLKMLEWYL